MKSLHLKYNSKKIISSIFLSVLLLVLFSYTMFNAEYLSLREPPQSGRYRWVGQLGYNNEHLIFTGSLIFNILFLTILINLIIKFFRKNMTLSFENNILYLNGHYFLSRENIKKIEIVNKNSLVLISIKYPKKAVEERTKIIDKLIFKLRLLFNKNKLIINISYLNEQPSAAFNKIKNFIKGPLY
ncbi:hypothetical protein FLAN108750_08330 [Flavobacterium antarcticum]|uniref:hypothetical protein n=1 Tax=Flavobacterium antarcticum TaxID=271155 RepID=UPI000429AFDE|nr:hypothetical protein [Flavobacterium antarcticum]